MKIQTLQKLYTTAQNFEKNTLEQTQAIHNITTFDKTLQT